MKYGGGTPAKFICKVDDFTNRYKAKFDSTPHLDLNGKRTYELDEKVIDEFVSQFVDNIGFIE